MTEFIKTFTMLFIAFILMYAIVTLFTNKNIKVEGLTNMTKDVMSNGEAGSSASYSDNIKAHVIKLQDELLVSKYRKDYENTIINMDDLIGTMMIKKIQNMPIGGSDSNSFISSLNDLNALRLANESLNVSMKYLDTM